MPVSVSNSNATITISDGSSIIRVSKTKLIVTSEGNNVRLEWGRGGAYIEYPYTDFTAPTGASAEAVANAIEVFLDPGSTVSENVAVYGSENSGTNLRILLTDSSGSLIPGTGATNLGKAIDNVAGAADTGIAILSIKDNQISATTPAEGDYDILRTDQFGALWVKRGQVIIRGAAKTRPNDTTAYTAGDVISESASAGTGFGISNIVPISGGGGWITRIVVRCSQISITPRIRVHLFDTIPTNTVLNDNAPATTIYAASITEIGTVDLPAMISGATNSGSVTFVHDQYLNFLVSGTDITVILETLDAFTPSASNSWYVELTNDAY